MTATLAPERGPTDAVELRIARHMARAGTVAAPVGVVAAGAWRGPDGALSAAFGIGIVVANVLLAACLAAWAARISPAALYGAVLGGYVLRLGVITAVVMAVHSMAWVDVIALGISIVVAQLGLLAWEVRSLSLSAKGDR